jgi:hypothetical protein
VNNQEILDNAPEGATHYANTGYCYRKETETDFYLWANGKWYLSHGVYTHTRSLSDIKRIAELELWKKNACERMRGLSDSIDGYVEKIALAAHYIEQQDKRIAELENVLQGVIVSYCLDEIDERVLVDVLAKGGTQ